MLLFLKCLFPLGCGLPAELHVGYAAHSAGVSSLQHTGHLLGHLLLLKWPCFTFPQKAMFSPPSSPPISTGPGHIRKNPAANISRRCGLPADIPTYPLRAPLEEGMQRTRPANDHRGCCSAKDYEIRGGGSGVIKVTAQCGPCAVFHIYIHGGLNVQRCIVHSLDYDADK